MKQKLKFLFGCFFSHTALRNADGITLGTSILGGCLAFLILLGALLGGRSIGFGVSYAHADAFRQFASAAFEELSFTVKDGIATGDAQVHKTVDEYRLVIDFRDTDGLYDDFTVVGTAANGSEVTYEEYRLLSSAAKENVTLRVVYSGNVLAYASEEKQAQYLSYLEEVCDASSAGYDANIASAFSALDAEKENYPRQVYELYVQSYYAEASVYEFGGSAPTIRGYYESLQEGKYLMLLRSSCYVSYEGFSFAGYYKDGTYSGAESLDACLRGTFTSGSSLYAVLYIMNLCSAFPTVLILWLLLGCGLYLVCRKRRIAYAYRFWDAVTVVGAFLPVSALLTGVIAGILSFFAAPEAVYSGAMLCLLGVFGLRGVLLIFGEIVRPLADIPDMD